MALTDDFSYRLGDEGVILNPDAVTPPFVDIVDVQGLDSPPFRQTERDHEGTDGGFMDANYEKGRNVILEGLAYADVFEAESFLDSLKANYAPSRALIPFYFKKPGVTERFLRVKPLGVRYNVNSLRRVGATDVQFLMFAEDPRIYTSSIRNPSIAQAPVINTGRSYNRAYNYSYGVAVSPSTVNMFVGGNRNTPVIFTMTGPAEQPAIINDTLGLTMQFDLSIPAGSVLTVDTYYHTVRLDGANRRSVLNTPDWFHLRPGDNFIRYRSTINGGSVLSAQYYDAWR